MVSLMKKLGITFLTASCLGTALTLAAPQEAKAQAGANTGLCVPAVANGRVRCDYDNGDRYVGNFVNGLPNGEGTYVYANGARYVGSLSNGVPSGQGTYIFPDDARVTGLYQNGKIQIGTALFANGDRYEGQFDTTRKIEGPPPTGEHLSLLTAIATKEILSATNPGAGCFHSGRR